MNTRKLTRSLPKHLFRRDGARSCCGVPPMPVRGGVGRMVVRGTRRPLDDRVTRAGRAVISPVLAAMVPARRLQILGFVTTACSAPQEVGTATQEVGPPTPAPLQLL